MHGAEDERERERRSPDNGGPRPRRAPPSPADTPPHPIPHGHTPRLVRAPPACALGRRSRRPHEIHAGPHRGGRRKERRGDGARQAPRGRFPPRAPHIFLTGGPGRRRAGGANGESGPWAPRQRRAGRAADRRLAGPLTFSPSARGPRRRRAGQPAAPPTESLGILCGHAHGRPRAPLSLRLWLLGSINRRHVSPLALCERSKWVGPGGPRAGARLRQGGWHVGKPTTKSDRAGAGGYDGWDPVMLGPSYQ